VGSETLAARLIRRYSRLSGVAGVLSIVAATLVAAAQMIGALKDVSTKLWEWLGISQFVFLHYFMVGVVVVLTFGAAFFAWLWINRALVQVRVPTDRRRLASASIAIALAAFCSIVTYSAMPSTPQLEPHISKHVIELNERLASSFEQKGGIRVSSHPTSIRQVWATAQSIAAISRPPSNVTRDNSNEMRKGFHYIQDVSLGKGQAEVQCIGASLSQESGVGWGYIDELKWGVTEVTGWVALAYIYALSPENRKLIWPTESEQRAALKELGEILRALMTLQLSEGGWAPIATTRNDYARTYSTVIALWALAEAHNKILSDNSLEPMEPEITANLENQIRKGVLWLDLNYTPELESWVPNPSRPSQTESFEGLTAQVLYVINLARVKHYPLRDNLEDKYQDRLKSFYKHTFLDFPLQSKKGTFGKRAMRTNDRSHDSDRYLPGLPFMIESSTFLWGPWVLALCSVSNRPSLDETTGVAAEAAAMCRVMGERANELMAFARGEFTYVTAETMLAAKVYLCSKTEQGCTLDQSLMDKSSKVARR
jgi:hypothetical protein